MNLYYVYILQSQKNNRYYIGYTASLEKRLTEHNRGKTKSLKDKGHFEFVYIEEYKDKQSATARERQIKSYKGGEAFRKLVRKGRELGL